MKLTNNGWELDSNDNRALKHTNKKELFYLIKRIELVLEGITGEEMSYKEKEIYNLINDKTQPLYFK